MLAPLGASLETSVILAGVARPDQAMDTADDNQRGVDRLAEADVVQLHRQVLVVVLADRLQAARRSVCPA